MKLVTSEMGKMNAILFSSDPLLPQFSVYFKLSETWLACLQYTHILILVWHYTFALFSLNYAKIPILEEAQECRDGPEGAEIPAH